VSNSKISLDMLDYPTAWAIQETADLKHGDRCSSVPGWDPLSGPMWLCDCGAVEAHWEQLRQAHDG